MAVSHPEIILELYNKSSQVDIEVSRRWEKFIVALAIEGDEVDLSSLSDLEEITYVPLDKKFLKDTQDNFKKLGMKVSINTRSTLNFSLEELKILVHWIALQEDMNYPMNRHNYEGRRMPFRRYLEAL